MALANGSSRAWRKQRLRVLQRDQYTCAYCGVLGANHVDHIVPRVDGGGDEMSNLCASCANCNQRKNSAPVGVFLGRLDTPPAFPAYLSPITTSSGLAGPFEGQPRPSWN